MVTPQGPAGPVRLLPGAGLAGRLEAWVAAARIDEAALQRSRARWLSELADQEAHLGGVLLELGERRAVAAVRLRGGRTRVGRVEVVGADFAALRTAQGVVLVSQQAIVLVRPGPAEDEVVGDQPLATDVQLVEVLRELAADQEPVRLMLVDGGEAVAGVLRRVGVDVAAIRVDGGPPATVHVPVAAVAEVALG